MKAPRCFGARLDIPAGWLAAEYVPTDHSNTYVRKKVYIVLSLFCRLDMVGR